MGHNASTLRLPSWGSVSAIQNEKNIQAKFINRPIRKKKLRSINYHLNTLIKI
jgi:hypothetical protein